MATDMKSNLYVVDSGSTGVSGTTIRFIDMSSHEVYTLAGHPSGVGHVDGSGSSVYFENLMGVAVSRNGSGVYVVDNGEHVVKSVGCAGM